MKKQSTKSNAVNIVVISEEALLNYIASNNDYDVNQTQSLSEILGIAKLTINPLFAKDHACNTIIRQGWDISNKDVTRARNHILEKLNLDLRM